MKRLILLITLFAPALATADELPDCNEGGMRIFVPSKVVELRDKTIPLSKGAQEWISSLLAAGKTPAVCQWNNILMYYDAATEEE